MATFVLVPGFWLGGWAWRDVTAQLHAAGHDVYAVTLTGLGERVHLGGPQVNLDTHIADVVNISTYEDLHDIYLVGHSYAGQVISGVAEQVPERIAKLIYVDTAPLPDGFALADFDPAEKEANQQRVASEGDGWRLRLPTWAEFGDSAELNGLDEQMRGRMRAFATDQPYNAALQPLRLSNPARKALPKLAIWCVFSSNQVRDMVASGIPLFSELAGDEWTFVDLPTGHWPMFSRPNDLAKLLIDAAT